VTKLATHIVSELLQTWPRERGVGRNVKTTKHLHTSTTTVGEVSKISKKGSKCSKKNELIATFSLLGPFHKLVKVLYHTFFSMKFLTYISCTFLPNHVVSEIDHMTWVSTTFSFDNEKDLLRSNSDKFTSTSDMSILTSADSFGSSSVKIVLKEVSSGHICI